MEALPLAEGSYKFKQIETLRDLSAYLAEWIRESAGTIELYDVPIRYVDWQEIEGAHIEVGIITTNGKPEIAISQRGTFGGAPT